MKKIVVEKLSSTAITPDLAPDWLVVQGLVEDAVNDGVDYMEEVLDFLEEFKIDSDRKISVIAFDKEPRACGSCHMLATNFGDNKYIPKNLKCVYENGPEFEFGSPAKWFKLCEYYIQRTD
ncbi:MAG: hypothetical protein ACW99G_11375 [Candidatus Thorarchaeota archaeon]|jgi:hypothetical protein